jgi:hypothetical protein
VAFFVENRQSRQALGKDFVTHVKKRVRRGMNDHASAWLSAVEGLPAIHERLKRVVVENRPALDVIRKHDSDGTFFYLDPPYLHETRTVTDAYGDFEMTVADHRELLDVLLRCKGKAMLSGYANELYDKTLAGWTRHEFDLPNNAASGKEKRRMTEVVWCNFGSEGDNRCVPQQSEPWPFFARWGSSPRSSRNGCLAASLATIFLGLPMFWPSIRASTLSCWFKPPQLITSLIVSAAFKSNRSCRRCLLLVCA